MLSEHKNKWIVLALTLFGLLCISPATAQWSLGNATATSLIANTIQVTDSLRLATGDIRFRGYGRIYFHDGTYISSADTIAITGVALVADAVSDSSKIATGAVRSSDILDADIKSADIDTSAIDSIRLAPSSVQSTDINDGQVKTADLAANSIDSTKLAASSVQSSDIKDGQIINADVHASAAIDGSKLASHSITYTQLDTAAAGFIDVRKFGAIGDGVTDDRAAIQAAIDYVHTNGGIVFIPKGTYIVGRRNPLAGSSTALMIKTGVELAGAGMFQTIIKRDAGGLDNDVVLRNENTNYPHGGVGDSSIVIRDLTIDGNQDNKNANCDSLQYGIYFDMCKEVYLHNVRIKEIFGTTNGSGGESFSFTFNECRNVYLDNCIAEGSATSSTGFSQNGSTNVSYSQCYAYGFKYIGFTNYGSNGTNYINCTALDNAGYSGFNNEQSYNTIYTNCIAGLDTIPSALYTPFNDSSGQSHGNAHGFVTYSTHANSVVSFINCVAQKNSLNGIEASGMPYTNVIGCTFINNANGVHQTDTDNVLAVSNSWFLGNTTHDISIGTGDYQYVDPDEDKPFSFYYPEQVIVTPLILEDSLNVTKNVVMQDGLFITDNVGVGTSSPSGAWTRNIHIHDAISGGSAGITASQPSKSYSVGIANTAFAVYDNTAGQYRFTINTIGNVGFGTTSPDKTIGIGGGPDEFSISVSSDKLTFWNDAATPVAKATLDSVGGFISGSQLANDSLKIGSASNVWARKIFWSVTGDSMGVIAYNTVKAVLDTAWLVTK